MDPELFFILLVTGNFLILIICLMAMQACYFKGNWKWYWLMLVAVVISAASLGILVYQRMVPPTDDTLPDAVLRHPTTPL